MDSIAKWSKEKYRRIEKQGKKNYYKSKNLVEKFTSCLDKKNIDENFESFENYTQHLKSFSTIHKWNVTPLGKSFSKNVLLLIKHIFFLTHCTYVSYLLEYTRYFTDISNLEISTLVLFFFSSSVWFSISYSVLMFGFD